jgi:hypothetical protein
MLDTASLLIAQLSKEEGLGQFAPALLINGLR